MAFLRRRPAGLRDRGGADPARRSRPRADARRRPPLRLRLSGRPRRPRRHRLGDGFALRPLRQLDPAVEAGPGRTCDRLHARPPAVPETARAAGGDPARRC